MTIIPGAAIHVHHMRDPETVVMSSVDIAMDAGEDPNERVWNQIAKSGDFSGHHAGPFSLNENVFREIVTNFHATRQPIPIDFEHASESDPTSGGIPVHGSPAQGWIHDLKIENGNLFGLVEWCRLAREYIREGRYKFFSPAVRFGSRDRVTGKPIGARLTSGALTNQPFLSNMRPLVASDKQVAIETATHVKPDVRADAGLVRLMSEALGLPAYADARLVRDAVVAVESATDEDTVAHAARLADALHVPVLERGAVMFNDVIARLDEIDDDEDDQDEGGDADEGETRMSDRESAVVALSEAKAKESELTMKLTASESKNAALETELKTLRDAQKARDEADLASEVDRAIAVYKDSKGANETMRPHLMSWARSDRAGFRAMYPEVEPGKEHLQRNLTENVREPSAGNPVVGGAGAVKVSTREMALQLSAQKGIPLEQAQRAVLRMSAKR